MPSWVPDCGPRGGGHRCPVHVGAVHATAELNGAFPEPALEAPHLRVGDRGRGSRLMGVALGPIDIEVVVHGREGVLLGPASIEQRDLVQGNETAGEAGGDVGEEGDLVAGVPLVPGDGRDLVTQTRDCVGGLCVANGPPRCLGVPPGGRKGRSSVPPSSCGSSAYCWSSAVAGSGPGGVVSASARKGPMRRTLA